MLLRGESASVLCPARTSGSILDVAGGTLAHREHLERACSHPKGLLTSLFPLLLGTWVRWKSETAGGKR